MNTACTIVTVVGILVTVYSIVMTKKYLGIKKRTTVQMGGGGQQAGGGLQVGAGSGRLQTADQTAGNVGGNQFNVHIHELHIHEAQTNTRGTQNGGNNNNN